MPNYILVIVPYWEWDGRSGMDERRKYLKGKLQCNVDVDTSPHLRQEPVISSSCIQREGSTSPSGGGGASESVVLSESGVSGPNKSDTEQVKIDSHLEQQCRKAETSPSGGAAAGVTAPVTIVIKSVW